MRDPDSVNYPPFEAEDLRAQLADFLATPFDDPVSDHPRPVGGFIWGVYAFFDYDGEPIYVGQTKEKISTRIRRHLTNQRTDAVAMSVLDPFEVYEVEVWPLPQFELRGTDMETARAHLDALERKVFDTAIAASRFQAILNEKDPPISDLEISLPPSLRARIVSDHVHRIRVHPDFRIARRALILSRLAQAISERKVQSGLRRVLLTQSQRLEWLANRRHTALAQLPPDAPDAADDRQSDLPGFDE